MQQQPAQQQPAQQQPVQQQPAQQQPVQQQPVQQQPAQQQPVQQQPAGQPMPGASAPMPVQQQPYYAQQQPPYYAQQQVPIPPMQKKPDETLAIVSMCLGIASFIMGLFILASIPGVVVGHMARKRIKTEPDKYGGASMATAGLVIGWINIASSLFVIILTIAMFVLPFCMACGVGLLGAAGA
ncbi:MAG: DUF4190 domain-containing protein [Deltaproteobacteria bacterium]|nr:DUF4190 domain-containing protein [Deltaproteobacteria bacterium]